MLFLVGIKLHLCLSQRPIFGKDLERSRLFDIKRHSRSRFKYEVRRLRQREKHIRRSKLAEAMSSKDVNSFWSQVRRINSSKSASSSSIVDSVSGAPHIANVFSAKLESLLNSRSTSACE